MASHAGGSPTLASLGLFMGTLFFEYSSPTNLVVDHPIKDTFLYYMGPDIPGTAPTAVCSLKRHWKCFNTKQLWTRTRLRGGSSSSIFGEAKGREMTSLVDLTRRILPDPPRPLESSRED